MCSGNQLVGTSTREERRNRTDYCTSMVSYDRSQWDRAGWGFYAGDKEGD